MATALELATRGRGAVEPNPMVGAIIVSDAGEIAGGWHGRFGGPHAEIEAMQAAQNSGCDLAGACMYVTLEPCCHHGKTPPCTEAIIAAKVARVVIAMLDPDEKVAGRGVAALQDAGLEVTVGICEGEARKLLAAYRKLRIERRPWVICKWAQTADGFLALPPGGGRWISGESARAYSHQLRGLCDAICVGVNTVITDDPLLSNRSGSGTQPARIVLDSKLRIPADCQLVRTSDSSPVIVATTTKGLQADPSRTRLLLSLRVELLELPPAASGGVDLAALLDELGKRQWTYLLVEGGAKVLEAFIRGGLCDELLAFVSLKKVPRETENLPRFDIAELQTTLDLSECEVSEFADDRLLRYVLNE